MQHIWPLRYVLRPYGAGPGFVAGVVWGVLQYVVISLCLFVLDCLVWRPPWNEDADWFEESRGYVETGLKVVKSASCGCAMYNLGQLYHKARVHLGPIEPVLKFLSIKGVIFFVFWQGIVIAILGNAGTIPDNPEGVTSAWSRKQISAGIRDLLLCLEMVLFSELHRRAYPLPTGEESARFRASSEEGCEQTTGATATGRAALEALPLQDLPQLWREVRELRHMKATAPAITGHAGAEIELSQSVGRPARDV